VGQIFSAIFGGGDKGNDAPVYQAPPEDPSIKARREAEQQRAEQDRIRATQEQLSLETKQRNRKFGVRSLFGTPTRTTKLGSG
jgi:hypothetical protein